MAIEVSLVELVAGAGFLFAFGWAVRDYTATGASIERIEENIKTSIAAMVLNEAHSEAVRMLAEDDRMDELEERVQGRLDALSDEMNQRAELAEIDPVGANALGEERDPVYFPPDDGGAD